MDLKIVYKGLNYTHKRKKPILLITALGLSTYGAYRLCKSPYVIHKTNRLIKVLGALASITELLGDSAETIGVISKDLKDFIQSDSDQIPTSLKQVFKITKSDDFTESVVRVTTAFTVGILSGYGVEGRKDDSGISFSDKVFEKLFSPAGSGFVSVMVGSFTKNMVMALYADRAGGKDANSAERWVDVIADDKCRKVIANCIQQFVTTMVTVYLDKTMDVNTYDEIVAGLTNPKHEEKVRGLLALVCNGAIETFVRTSHQVLTNSRSNGNSDLLRRGSSTICKVLDGQESVLGKLKGGNIQRLAAPSNMRFVLDMTGRVTLATMKSFWGFSINRLSEGIKRKIQEAYRYLSAKSLIIMTICISLYLHMLSGPWSLMQV